MRGVECETLRKLMFRKGPMPDSLVALVAHAEAFDVLTVILRVSEATALLSQDLGIHREQLAWAPSRNGRLLVPRMAPVQSRILQIAHVEMWTGSSWRPAWCETAL